MKMEAYEETLTCTVRPLAIAEDEDGIEYVQLEEFTFPRYGGFSDRRIFIVRHRIMDWESDCWDRVFNDLKSAMACFGKEANRKFRYTGETVATHKVYGKVEYSGEWKYYREELSPTDGERVPSATAGDYGPGNPWDAPGMSVSDFISGVY